MSECKAGGIGKGVVQTLCFVIMGQMNQML